MALKSPEGPIFIDVSQKSSDAWSTGFRKSAQGLVDLLRKRGGEVEMSKSTGRPNIDFTVITSVSEGDEVRSILLYSSGSFVSLANAVREPICEVVSVDPYDLMEFYATFKYPDEIFEKSEETDTVIKSLDDEMTEEEQDEEAVEGLGLSVELFVEENKDKLKKELQKDIDDAFRKVYGVVN